MNSLRIEIDKSNYCSGELNYMIDDFWLDEKLDKLYPNRNYKGLIPTLLGLYDIEEEKLVWDRILPKVNENSICPILMCPDDCDFCCTLIVAEVENLGSTIRWNKIGVDYTADAKNLGKEVEWFKNIAPFEFSEKDYMQMLLKFKKHNTE